MSVTACAIELRVTPGERQRFQRTDDDRVKTRDRASEVSSLDTRRKFVLDNRFFSSIIYILYEGEALRPPVDTQVLSGVK